MPTDARLAPLVRSVPSALEYTGGASLAPGDYTLKLAAADGDRVGTVEHAIHASVTEAGALRLSDLMVGDPADRSDLLQPSVGSSVSYGRVHGYLEAYGTALESLKVRYELAATDASPALAAADVPGRLVGRRPRAVHARDADLVAPRRPVRAARRRVRAQRAADDAHARVRGGPARRADVVGGGLRRRLAVGGRRALPAGDR